MQLQLRYSEISGEMYPHNKNQLENGSQNNLVQVPPEKEESMWNNPEHNVGKPPMKRRKVKRGVHFAAQALEIFPHIHLDDMTKDEKFAYWMSRSELQQTRYEAVYTYTLIKESPSVNPSTDLTLRGLEPRELRCIAMVRDCVLRLPNSGGQELSATLYGVETEKALRKARLRGVSDAEEVAKMYSIEYVEEESKRGNL